MRRLNFYWLSWRWRAVEVTRLWFPTLGWVLLLHVSLAVESRSPLAVGWRFCTFGITGKELILTVFGWESGSPMPLSFFCERHRSKWESRHSTLRQMLSDERSHTLFFVFFHAIFLSYCIWSPSRFLLIDMTKTWHTQLLFSAFFSLKKNYNQSKFFYLVKAKYLSL